MRIYSPGPIQAPPRLQQLGIRIQTVTAAPTAAVSEQPEDSFARQTLSRISGFEPVRLTAFPAGRPPLLASGPAKTELLQALQALGDQLDLPTALSLQAAASQLIEQIRQHQDLPANLPVTLEISGAFGQIQLDPAELAPERLRATFAAALSPLEPDDLSQQYTQLGSLPETIRQELNPPEPDWHAALAQPHFEPESFYRRSFGFNPLDARASVRHLIRQLPPPEPEAALPDALGDDLARRSDELIQLANQLEQQLELAPSVESPDLLKLLRNFRTILNQLDADVGRILSHQHQHKQFQHQLLKRFGETLQHDLDLTRDRRQQLAHQRSERLRHLVDHAFVQIQAKLALALAHQPQPALQQALARLTAR